jgi:amino acid transporter
MNSGARILYPMGRLGVFHRAIGSSHDENETPHVAVTVMAILIFLSPAILTMVFKLDILDAFNDAGTFGAFGFLGAYFLISLAAPAYLRRAGILRGRDIALSAASVVLLLVPAVGSIYPVPSWPVNIFPYIFGGYLLIGIVWFMRLRRRTGFTEQVRSSVYVDHDSLAPADVTPIKRERSSIPA